jgi:membrane-associated phospholipid phosphatase/serine/threonine-protein kinase RIO1
MDVSRSDVVSGEARESLDLDVGRRRRRPTGEPPPLPRHLGRSGVFWLVMVGYFVVTIAGVVLFEPLEAFYGEVDTVVMDSIEEVRTEPLVDAATSVNLLASRWTIRILRWSTILALIVFRRWRHLLVFVLSLLVLEFTVYQMTLFIARPRPFDVVILGSWTRFAMPSQSLAGLGVTLLGMLYSLVPHGRTRDVGKWIVGGILGILMLSRWVLGVEAPSDSLFGAVFGVAVGLTAFRYFAPNDIFPVTYGGGKAAHLDVGGRRGEAIVKAVADQIGVRVVAIRPIGLEASGGSTPLRLTIERDGGDTEYLFAKLYAMSHVRSDKWYKLGRQILYGALEDETPFGSVRRFVEAEDYALRFLHDHGFPSPKPYGVVEISPEREYMSLMEFFDDAVELGEADIDEAIIDQGLQVVRRLWDAGVAHRDIKPANLMVQNGQLRVIDVSFIQVRPSPWRQAIDLGNMMLVLALRSDADTVYRRALTFFTPDEIAEAFAATHGVAIPSQLRNMLAEDPRDLPSEFRRLGPQRPTIRIQRWNVRRVVRTAWVSLVALILLALLVSNWNVFA